MYRDAALQWDRKNRLLEVHQSPGTALQTTANLPFPMNYLDRMIRHRVNEQETADVRGG